MTSRTYWQRWREERRREKTHEKYAGLEAAGQVDLFSEGPRSGAQETIASPPQEQPTAAPLGATWRESA